MPTLWQNLTEEGFAAVFAADADFEVFGGFGGLFRCPF